MKQKAVFSLLVDNEAGVLTRVAGLFARRAYNIESLTVGETLDKRFSRMTVVAEGEPEILDQIEKQVGKLVDIRRISQLPPESSVYRELVLIKVEAAPERRPEIIAIADIFRANIVDVTDNTLMIELTGTQSKIDACIKLLENYTIIEMARTGVTGMSRGIPENASN